MASQLYALEQPSIDILKQNGLYIGSIWLYDMPHHVGPANTHAELVEKLSQCLQDLQLIANIKSRQNKPLSELQFCLSNYYNDDVK